jgi:hypothetical protein
MYKNYLMHYGIKGMKWGVRRTEKLRKQRQASEDHKKKKELKKKKIHEMSNAELKELNNRLQLEKQYKDLNSTGKGKSFVSKILKASGDQVATKLVTGVALYAAKQVISAKFGEDVATAVLPKKK